MKLSIVATLYQSARHLAEFHARCSRVAGEVAGDDYEIVLVNDGSPDDSLERAIRLTESDPRVVVVDLSRNFGHHKAMMTGLEHARGDRVFLIDSDLEEEPEWLGDFARAMDEERVDVVYGRQQERKGGWFERWSGEVYYTLFNWLTDLDHPRNIVTARLMTRRYVDALLRYRERELVISCLWVSAGFRQSERIVKKHSSSATTYTMARKLANAVNAITSFSEVPLRLIFYVGMAIFTISVVYAVKLVIARLVFEEMVDGWTSVMVSIWVLGGLVISFVGIIGIYLSKVFSETKQRPYTIVREVHGQSMAAHR